MKLNKEEFLALVEKGIELHLKDKAGKADIEFVRKKAPQIFSLMVEINANRKLKLPSTENSSERDLLPALKCGASGKGM
ncbi:MAG: hypothetical protein QS98_C0010G0052 [archaeon GW2011_AR3]|nr:MAG: hypothetical protein QS98_C0010G0052 [archaeon GW2011_AR3]MBS3110191.1 hypothetical protein [Candidatus Woesearchaeota archaeon]